MLLFKLLSPSLCYVAAYLDPSREPKFHPVHLPPLSCPPNLSGSIRCHSMFLLPFSALWPLRFDGDTLTVTVFIQVHAKNVVLDRPRMDFWGKLLETCLEEDAIFENGLGQVLHPPSHNLCHKRASKKCWWTLHFSKIEGKSDLRQKWPILNKILLPLMIAMFFCGFLVNDSFNKLFLISPKISQGDLYIIFFESTFFFDLKTWMTFASPPLLAHLPFSTITQRFLTGLEHEWPLGQGLIHTI